MNITDHGLHLLHGDSAGGAWLDTFNAEERLLVLQDHLSSGPLIQTPDMDSWNSIRAAYWHDVHPEWHCSDDEDSREQENRRETFTNLERLKTSESVYIWAGNNTGDQLFILFAINLLSLLGVDSDLIHIVQLEAHDDWNLPFVSMASFSQNDLRAIPTPTQPSPDLLKNYQAAWAAVTAGTPTEIMRLLEKRPEVCPHLRRSLERLLLRYPQERSGLSLFDEWLLRNVEKSSPSTVAVLGETLIDALKVGDEVGDITLYKRLLRMASNNLPEPLVNIQGPTPLYRDTQVTLTDFGRSVVEGRACSWPTNPIDDWIGGVRLSAEHPPQWMVTPEGKLRRINDFHFES